jgi:hypothetical protein
MEAWHWLEWPALAIAAVAALFGLDRIGLWLEDRGWLYYRRKRTSSSPMSSWVAMQQIIEPGVRHVVEVKHHQRSEKEKEAGRERLFAMLVEVLRSSPANGEAIRFYLASAKGMGLDWRALYEEAARAVGGTRLPSLDEVGPDD